MFNRIYFDNYDCLRRDKVDIADRLLILHGLYCERMDIPSKKEKERGEYGYIKPLKQVIKHEIYYHYLF